MKDHPSSLTPFLSGAEQLLGMAGAALLLGWIVLVGDSFLAQVRARTEVEAAVHIASLLPASSEHAAGMPRPYRPVETGSPVGILSIPRIGLSAVVLHGSDDRTLRHGPGHLEGTALPGEIGNSVFAGHRDSFFRPLRTLQIGDDVFVDTPTGRFQYRVESVRVVDPRDVSVLAPTSAPALTLVTCYPFWVLGSAPDRFVAQAAIVDTAASAGAAPGVATPEVE